MERRYLRHSIVMILLFLLAGFSIVLYLLQMYSTFWGMESFGPRNDSVQNRSFETSRMPVGERFIRPLSAEAVLTSPFSFLLLFIGISSTLGAISVWQLTREKELKSMKEDITSLLLTPEEKAIVDELKRANGKMNQNQLVKRTGFSKVRIHRALVRLETRKIIKKYPYGLTNKVVLEKTSI